MSQENRKEKFNGYAFSFGLAQGGGFTLIQATVATYFTIFLTDTVGIAAGAASLMMFLCTLFDAFKDPVVGALVDRTNTRIGRYRVYFLFMPVIFVLVGIFMFSAHPEFSSFWKIAYTAFLYVMWGISYSFCLTAAQATLPAQTLDTKKRNFAIMIYTTCMAVSFTIASSFTTTFVQWVGGYVPLMIIYGILTIPPYITLFFTSKEKYVQPKGGSSFGKDLKTILKHKELYRVYLVWCMANLSYGIMFSASTYYVIYYLERPDLVSGYMLAVSLGALVSMTALLPIAMKLFKTPQRCLIVTQSITIGCYALLLFFGKSNVVVLFGLSFIAAAVCSMQHGLLGMLNNDLIDYIRLRDGVSLNGTMSSIRGFSMKFGSAFTSSLILGVLSASGYVAGAVGGQTETTMMAINCLRFIAPMIASGVVVLCMIWYPVTKYYPQIEEMKKGILESTES